MKTRTKALLLAMSALLLVVSTVFATMAFLTSTDTVQNTFTVGKVAITLDETDVDIYGKKETDDRVKTNDYKLLPGHTYIKDPTVHVKENSEESYIRMIVTITDYADVLTVFGADFLPQYFVGGWDNAIWVSTEEVKVENNAATYEFRYYKTVNTLDGNDLDLEALFTSITVPGTVKNDALALLEEMDINVVAQAIQADGFGGDANAAWAAFDAQAN